MKAIVLVITDTTDRKAAERGAKMVKHLLNFARKKPAKLERIEFNGLLNEEIMLLEHTALSKIVMALDLEPNLHFIQGDAGALAHAINNLCVNAMDAMEKDQTLTLRTRNGEGGWVVIQVEDTGCGIPQENLPKVMDPFFTTKDVGKGFGFPSLNWNPKEARARHPSSSWNRQGSDRRGVRCKIYSPKGIVVIGLKAMPNSETGGLHVFN